MPFSLPFLRPSPPPQPPVTLTPLPPELRLQVYSHLFPLAPGTHNPDGKRIFSEPHHSHTRRRSWLSLRPLSSFLATTAPVASNPLEAFTCSVPLPRLDPALEDELLLATANRVEHVVRAEDAASVFTRLPHAYRQRLRYATLDLSDAVYESQSWSLCLSDFFALLHPSAPAGEPALKLTRLRLVVPAPWTQLVLDQVCNELRAAFSHFVPDEDNDDKGGESTPEDGGMTTTQPLDVLDIDSTFVAELRTTNALYDTCFMMLQASLDDPKGIERRLPRRARSEFRFMDEGVLRLRFTMGGEERGEDDGGGGEGDVEDSRDGAVADGRDVKGLGESLAGEARDVS